MSSQPMKRHEENKCMLLTGRSHFGKDFIIYNSKYTTLDAKRQTMKEVKTSSSQELVEMEE